jgi:hypothetical protein
MKNLLSIQITFFLFLGLLLNAQVPQKMSYQALIRNAANNPVVNTSVGMKISILQNSASGSAVYVETQTPTTNANGLISIEIGGGNVVSGIFTNINWATGTYYIKTESDPTGGTNYSITGTSQLLCVPYAFHAKTADSIVITNVIKPPYSITTTPSQIQHFTAILKGIVNGNGFITSVDFEWGLTTAYGNTVTAVESPIKGATNTVVSKTINGLQSGTTYHYRLKVTNPIDITYSDDISFRTANSTPQLSTALITNITANSSECGGSITHDGGSAIIARGICWSTTSNPTITNSKTTDGNSSGSFTSQITGLNVNTIYYVRAYATNNIETAYGDEKIFSTLPTVTTSAVTTVTNTTSICGGTVSEGGNAIISNRGVCWSTNTNPTIANSKTNNGAGIGSFTSSISGLVGNTTYYMRAYATNSGGTAYGSAVSFTTIPSLPTVSTKALSSMSTTNLNSSNVNSGGTVSGTGVGAISARGVCWSTSLNPTINDSKTTDGSGTGTYNSSLSGLTFNTVYYLRAYATNSVGTAYGSEISFRAGIGALYQGGIIFHVFQPGDYGYVIGESHGLIAAQSDQSTSASWICQESATGTAIGTGYQNTVNVMASCPGASAVKICYDLVLNGYSDWYLPSKDELNILYLNRDIIGGFTGESYLSSSKSDNSVYVWDQNFLSGWQQGNFAYMLYVRAIRSF